MGTELVLLLAGVISADLLLRGKILKKLIAVLIFMSMIPGPFINGFQAVTGPDWNGIYTLSGRIIRDFFGPCFLPFCRGFSLPAR